MSDLIPKNTDEEMERYNEADMIRRARIPMEGNAALKFEHDPDDQARERAVSLCRPVATSRSAIGL
jgi:hypothetical protein